MRLDGTLWSIGVGLLAAASLRLAPPIPAQAVHTAPSNGLLRAVSLSHETAAATALWATVVSANAEGRASPRETIAAVRTCGDLDPTWSAPWAYGALIVRALGDIDAHETLLTEAMRAHPDEAWFPYTLGMSRYLNHGDRQGAADYLEIAADLPGGSEVHRRAARAIRQR